MPWFIPPLSSRAAVGGTASPLYTPVMSSKASILLVEDHPALAETVGDFLEARGYTVDFAADGLLALQLATTEHFDAIVLDLMLPGINGLEVCRRLRREAQL